MALERSEGGLARLQVLLATVFGIGYAPVAPGTFGSIPGVALAWCLHAAGGSAAVFTGFVVVTLVGFSVAGGAARSLGAKDPGPVVVDETAGQMLTLWLVVPTPGALALGFFLFRLFDVWKPFPARRLESLPGGSGIMADDLAAGVYANLVLHGAVFLAPGLLGRA
jgi:phosphatidylglycerophosphatase A